jgi:hypothetical protein
MRWSCRAVAFAFAAIACATPAKEPNGADTSGTWYWRSLESATNRWHTAQGDGTLSWHGARFDLDLRDGASGTLAYHLTGTRSGKRLIATAVAPDTDRQDIPLVGDIEGDRAPDSTNRQTIVFRGPYTVLALTRDNSAKTGGDGACRDPRFDSLVARGARSTLATREFALPADAWKLGDNAACGTVIFRVGAEGRAENPRVVESYPEEAAAKAALETIRAFRFQVPGQTELALRFRIYHPATE